MLVVKKLSIEVLVKKLLIVIVKKLSIEVLVKKLLIVVVKQAINGSSS